MARDGSGWVRVDSDTRACALRHGRGTSLRVVGRPGCGRTIVGGGTSVVGRIVGERRRTVWADRHGGFIAPMHSRPLLPTGISPVATSDEARKTLIHALLHSLLYEPHLDGLVGHPEGTPLLHQCQRIPLAEAESLGESLAMALRAEGADALLQGE